MLGDVAIGGGGEHQRGVGVVAGVVEPVLADPHPRLGDELRIGILGDQLGEGVARIFQLALLLEHIGEQVLRAIDKSIVGKFCDQRLIERDRFFELDRRLRAAALRRGRAA